MKEKLYRFMQGRYGNDQFNQFLLIASVISIVLSFFGSSVFYPVALVILGYTYFRMFSKNTYKRSEENRKYLQVTAKMRLRIQKWKNEMQQRKTHHIYKCPSCKQKIRVPKGKGRIEIKCPKCQNRFIKKS